MPTKQITSVKINLSKVDKDKLFKSEKTDAVYLDATILWNDSADKYGNDGMIVQDIGKKARDAGEKGAILGNVKQIEVKSKESAPIQDDDLPF